MAVVYCIRNKDNGKIYIGSAINFRQRISRHFRMLKRGKHHSKYLQRSYDIHGESAFEAFIIEDNIPKEKMYEREQYYLDLLKPFSPNGYNMSRIASGVSLPGKLSPFWGKRGSSHPAYGYVHSSEERQRMSKSMKGKKHRLTKEQRDAIKLRAHLRTGSKNGRFGKHWSAEKRMSISKKHSIKISQYDLISGNFIRVWESSKAASVSFGNKYSTSITACCKRRLKESHHFIWRYYDEKYCEGSNVFVIENTDSKKYNKRNRIY